MTGFSSSRSDTRRARCLPGGGCVRHRELAKRSPGWHSGRLPRSLALPRNDGIFVIAKRYPEGTLSPGWHSGRQSTLVVLPRSLALPRNDGIFVIAKRYPEGTLSPCWYSGRLPRSLEQKFVIASLRSDLPVDLAGDCFSHQRSGRLPRSLAQKFVIAIP